MEEKALTVMLDGVEELGKFVGIDLNATSDKRLQEILQKEFCRKDSEFCQCCVGPVIFRIRRDCKHKISIWPQKDGVDIELYAED